MTVCHTEQLVAHPVQLSYRLIVPDEPGVHVLFCLLLFQPLAHVHKNKAEQVLTAPLLRIKSIGTELVKATEIESPAAFIEGELEPFHTLRIATMGVAGIIPTSRMNRQVQI